MKQEENVKEEVKEETKEEAGEKQQKNNFAQGSIVVNILKLAVPMTLAQLINVLYNIVDRLYIGQLKDEATISLTGECNPLPHRAGALPAHHIHCDRLCKPVWNGRCPIVFH